MPYDPDWDLEGEGGIEAPGALADFRSMSFGDGSDGMQGEDVGTENPWNDEHEGGGEDMEVDSPEHNQSRVPGRDADATPRSRPPFPRPARPGSSQVEVVLHSSPRRPDLSTPASRLIGDYDGDNDDDTNLVTSDLVPEPKTTHPKSAATTQSAHAGPQPPVTPIPFSLSAATPTAPHTVTPQPSRHGRPVGWRRGHGSYAALRAGLPPGSDTPGGPATPRPKLKKPASHQPSRGGGARRGRKPAPTARQLYLKLNPHFLTFRCEWADCPAELQNVDTLRKHLLIVHGRSSAPPPLSSSATATQPLFPCRWSACAAPPFTSLPNLTAHLETAHILPHLWHLGDGPRNTTPAQPPPPIPAYLVNPLSGQQITPSVADQQVENEDDRKRRMARVGRVMAQRDSHAPEEPEYTAREIEIISEVVRAREVRQRMFEGYAARVEREWVPT